MLIDVFAGRKERLLVHTCHAHAGNSYDYLQEVPAACENIRIILGENTGANFPQMLQEMASAQALLCPLLTERINYCVGLSTIADAMALSLPVVLTRNPYHPFDVEASGMGFAVDTPDSWSAAIDRLSQGDRAEKMGRRARRLAEENHNIDLFARQLMKYFEEDVKR